MDSMYLQGSEDVARGGASMHHAAVTFQNAVNQLDSSLSAYMQYMDNWLTRFEAAVEKFNQ